MRSNRTAHLYAFKRFLAARAHAAVTLMAGDYICGMPAQPIITGWPCGREAQWDRVTLAQPRPRITPDPPFMFYTHCTCAAVKLRGRFNSILPHAAADIAIVGSGRVSASALPRARSLGFCPPCCPPPPRCPPIGRFLDSAAGLSTPIGRRRPSTWPPRRASALSYGLSCLSLCSLSPSYPNIGFFLSKHLAGRQAAAGPPDGRTGSPGPRPGSPPFAGAHSPPAVVW